MFFESIKCSLRYERSMAVLTDFGLAMEQNQLNFIHMLGCFLLFCGVPTYHQYQWRAEDYDILKVVFGGGF